MLGSNPVLRRLKDDEEIRPLSANRNTIKLMEQRGMISPGKGREPLNYGVDFGEESKIGRLLPENWILPETSIKVEGSIKRIAI